MPTIHEGWLQGFFFGVLLATCVWGFVGGEVIKKVSDKWRKLVITYAGITVEYAKIADESHNRTLQTLEAASVLAEEVKNWRAMFPDQVTSVANTEPRRLH